MAKLLIIEKHGTAYKINENNEFVRYPINIDGSIDKDSEFFIDYSFLDQNEIQELEKIKKQLKK